MKRPLLILILLCCCLYGHAQVYTMGDTTGMSTLRLNVTLLDANSSVDIDCDHIPDIRFSSYLGDLSGHNWARLGFSMEEHTEVMNHNSGLVSWYETGDTVSLDADIWTPHLDFIFGSSPGGNYGRSKLDTGFITFRKITPTDTFYSFIEISTSGFQLNFHRIISSCSSRDIFTSLINPETKKLAVYPNPVSTTLNLGMVCRDITVYHLTGTIVKRFRDTNILDLGTLPPGHYLLLLKDDNGTTRSTKIEKQ